MGSTAALLRFTQMSTKGGSAETEVKALTVMPALPAGPSVTTTVTPVAAIAIASTKLCVDSEAMLLWAEFTARGSFIWVIILKIQGRTLDRHAGRCKCGGRH